MFPRIRGHAFKILKSYCSVRGKSKARRARMDGLFLTYIMIAIFLGALVRSYFSFGEALISMPLLALIGLDINTSISVIGLAGLSVAIFNTVSNFKNIKYKSLLIMLVGSFAGIPTGIYILNNFDTNKIQTVIAITLALYGFYSFFSRILFTRSTKGKLQSSFWGVVAGFISGILGSVYNTHGAPIVIYGTLSKWDLLEFKDTIQAHFIVTSIFVVIGQATGNIWTSHTLPIFLMSVPLLIIATFIGKGLARKTPNNKFEIWVFLLIGLLGVLLFVSK